MQNLRLSLPKILLPQMAWDDPQINWLGKMNNLQNLRCPKNVLNIFEFKKFVLIY